MNKNLLSYIICPECKKDELDIEIYASEYEFIGQGRIIYDPHMSPVRFIYDFIMKFWKLYDEEASDSLLFTEKQLIQMLHEAGIKCKTKTSTFCHRISSIFSINKIT